RSVRPQEVQGREGLRRGGRLPGAHERPGEVLPGQRAGRARRHRVRAQPLRGHVPAQGEADRRSGGDRREGHVRLPVHAGDEVLPGGQGQEVMRGRGWLLVGVGAALTAATLPTLVAAPRVPPSRGPLPTMPEVGALAYEIRDGDTGEIIPGKLTFDGIAG